MSRSAVIAGRFDARDRAEPRGRGLGGARPLARRSGRIGARRARILRG